MFSATKILVEERTTFQNLVDVVVQNGINEFLVTGRVGRGRIEGGHWMMKINVKWGRMGELNNDGLNMRPCTGSRELIDVQSGV